MTSLSKQWQNLDLYDTKQNIYHSKYIDESYPKNAPVTEFKPLGQNLWAFLSNFGSFYNARSPNMAMSRDPKYKF